MPQWCRPLLDVALGNGPVGSTLEFTSLLAANYTECLKVECLKVCQTLVGVTST